MVSVLAVLFFTIKASVAIESQPAALTNFLLKVPPLLHVMPFQLKGN